MVIPLDLRTLNFLLVVILFSLAPALAAIWSADRRQKDVGMIAGAFVGLGIYYLLVAVGDWMPKPLSIGVADLIGCVGFVLLWRSIRLRFRQPLLTAEITIFAVTIAALEFFTYIRPDPSSRVIVNSTFGLVISLLAVRELLHAPGFILRGYSAITFLAFVGLALLMSFRIIAAAAHDKVSGFPDDLQAGSLSALVLLICMGLYAVLALDTLRSGLARANDDLKLRNRELEAARDDADRANRAKSTFLASVSHEIRTPMNAVLGFADLLLGSTLTKLQRQQLTMLRDAEKSTLALIDDLLDLTRLEIGKLRFALVPAELAALVRGVIEMLRPAATSKGLELRADLPAGLPSWIEVDPTRLRQVLVNLLHNAIKFTDRGQIVVAVGRTDDAGRAQLRFEVSDTGIGISSDHQKRLFAEFSQIDGSIGQRCGGAGLGLAICKRVVEAFGGAIGVRSAVDAGSTFWFTIDLIEAVPPALVAEAVPSDGRRKLKVLLVEDSIANQVVIDAMLRQDGHDVAVVGTGSAAVDAVKQGAFDLVLMDIDMPGMDGVAASRAIRALGGPARTIPIVALTAYDMPTVKARCRRAVMNDYLRKPIDRKTLRVATAKWSEAAFDHQPRQDAPWVVAPSVVDLVTLGTLEDQIGHAKLLGLIKTFNRQLPDVVATIEGTIERDDIAREVHKLSSVTGYLGCVELARRCQELGDAIRAKEPSLAPLVAKIRAAAHRARKAMAQRYPELAVTSPINRQSNASSSDRMWRANAH